MNMPGLGVVELITIFAMTVLWLAVSVGILYLLFRVNKKLRKIEGLLQENNNQDKQNGKVVPTEAHYT